jgi:hypothetical protein
VGAKLHLANEKEKEMEKRSGIKVVLPREMNPTPDFIWTVEKTLEFTYNEKGTIVCVVHEDTQGIEVHCTKDLVPEQIMEQVKLLWAFSMLQLVSKATQQFAKENRND